MIAGPDAEVVGGAGIDVQLCRDAGLPQRQIHDYAMLRGTDNVGSAVREKDWGRLGWDVQAWRQLVLVLGLQVARINHNGEVRPTTDFVDIVDRFIGSLLKAGGRGDGQMAARRETANTNALWIDAPIVGFAPDQTDSALSVLQGSLGWLALGLPGAARHSIFENDAGHAQGIHPGRNFFTLQLPVEIPITASGTDQHRGAAVLILRRPIDRDRWLGDVGNHPGRLGDFDLLAVEFRRHADILGADFADLVRRLAGPQLHDLRLLCGGLLL